MQKVSFLLAAMMLAATPAFAQESETQAAVQETQAAVPETDAAAQSETNAAAQSETDAADAQTETGAAAQPAVLSDKWSDFQIQIPFLFCFCKNCLAALSAFPFFQRNDGISCISCSCKLCNTTVFCKCLRKVPKALLPGQLF